MEDQRNSQDQPQDEVKDEVKKSEERVKELSEEEWDNVAGGGSYVQSHVFDSKNPTLTS